MLLSYKSLRDQVHNNETVLKSLLSGCSGFPSKIVL